jgi:hypothetical protein
MNNGHTVAKKDCTASFKSKKEEVFELSTTKIWHEIKANVVTFWGQVLLWTMRKIFSQKDEDFSKLYQK